jgi:hypothetical protein
MVVETTSVVGYAAELMKWSRPHLTDWSMVARLRRIGIEVGKSFDFNSAPAGIRAALERAVVDGLELMKAKSQTLASAVNGWQMNTDTMGVYGNYYLKRAIIAMTGLGANQPEDAIYPMNLDRDDLKYNVDGSYAPKAEALDGRWAPPPIRKLS